VLTYNLPEHVEETGWTAARWKFPSFRFTSKSKFAGAGKGAHASHVHAHMTEEKGDLPLIRNDSMATGTVTLEHASGGSRV